MEKEPQILQILLVILIMALSLYIYNLKMENHKLNQVVIDQESRLISQLTMYNMFKQSFIKGCTEERIKHIGKHKKSFNFCVDKASKL